MTRLSDLGQAALVYARGWEWPVLPLVPGEKRPLVSQGFHAATIDPDRVLDAWTTRPNSNVGLATGSVSGLVVIDVDVDREKGIDGSVAMRHLAATLGPLTDRLVVRTPRGGWHLYFEHRGAPIPKSESRLGPGIDVRADGGYIVAPPSRSKVGAWSWSLPDGRLEPIQADLPALPDAWAEAMRKRERRKIQSATHSPNYVRTAIRDELHAVRAAREGTRNSTLNKSAYALAKFAESGQVRQGDLETLLLGAALEAGLEEPEARGTLRSALGASRSAA
jgi:hypothetical protein